jgi:hypothetical protein
MAGNLMWALTTNSGPSDIAVNSDRNELGGSCLRLPMNGANTQHNAS